MQDTLVIIPTFNEKENIEKIIRATFSQTKCFDILVVDDSSPDGTADIVKKLQEEHPKSLFLEVRDKKDGLGRAYIHGFKWAIKKKYDYNPNDFVVYPAHGVGKIVSIETQEVAGFELEMFVIAFDKDKMTLKVPTNKAEEVGMRALSSADVVADCMKTLKGKAKVKKAMWSRRAQEYEQKINSGDLIAIAEVVRDLHRADDQREQSYSERQLYEAALERLTREIAVVNGAEESTAGTEITDVLMSRVVPAAS